MHTKYIQEHIESLAFSYKLTKNEKLFATLYAVLHPYTFDISRHLIKPSFISYQELQNAGLAGLAIATETYKRSKGTTFSTWAYHCIRGEMQSYIREELRGTGFSYVTYREAFLLDSLRQQYLADHGQQPTLQTLSRLSGKSPKLIALRLSQLEQLSSKDLTPKLSSESIEEQLLDQYTLELIYHEAEAIMTKQQFNAFSKHFDLKSLSTIPIEELAIQENCKKQNISALYKTGIKNLHKTPIYANIENTYHPVS